MNRRAFLSALLAAPVAHELEPVRQVYSFLWAPAAPCIDVVNFTEVLKAFYHPFAVTSIMTQGTPLLDILVAGVDRERGTFTVGRAP